MPTNPNFVPSADNVADLGRADMKWNAVHATEFHGDGSNLTNVLEGTMTDHIIPDTNNAYDIGSADFKIRDMFVSDNSLWVGDNHKISIGSDGKMKMRKFAGSKPAAVDNFVDQYLTDFSGNISKQGGGTLFSGADYDNADPAGKTAMADQVMGQAKARLGQLESWEPSNPHEWAGLMNSIASEEFNVPVTGGLWDTDAKTIIATGGTDTFGFADMVNDLFDEDNDFGEEPMTSLSVESTENAGTNIFMAGDSGDVRNENGMPWASWTVDCNLFRGVGNFALESKENPAETILMVGDGDDITDNAGNPLASWTVDCNLFRGVGSMRIESTENTGNNIFMAGDSGDVTDNSGNPLASWTVDCNLFRPAPTIVGNTPAFVMHRDHGIVMGSPDNTAYSMSVDDSGNLTATALTGILYSQMLSS